MTRSKRSSFIADSLHPFVIYIEPSSPLENTKDATEKILFAAEKNIPAIITPCPSAGGTAPATMAGILVQALSIAMAALSGASLIHDVGYIESGLVGSYDMLVMSNEIIGMVKRIMGGIPVDEETLAVDVIAKVGRGGHFLGEKHTFKHFREFWLPELIDRSKVDDWEAAGAKTLGDRVHEKVINLIETYEPEPVPGDVENKLKEIIAQADERHKAEEKVALA
jgi:trimethylamine--corrinoid protein Co-methyltransferase